MSDARQPRFILVDPSAVHTGGHHYEYAARILKVAAERGFTPELWANKKSDLPQDDFIVRRNMGRTFYENFGKRGGLLARIIKPGIHGHMHALRERFLNLSFRFFLEHPIGFHAARAYHDAKTMHTCRPVYNGPQNRMKTPAFIYIFFYALFNLVWTLRHLSKRRPVRLVTYGLALVVGLFLFVVLLPEFLILGAIALCILMLKSNGKEAPTVLAEDLAKALKAQGEWTEQDIIFIPTCFLVEIKAMGVLFERLADMPVLPQFHLLFRTNIFSGTEDTYQRQLEGLLDFRLSFKWLRANHGQRAIHYFTDTEQLSRQYKVLSDEVFRVLPVPVPWEAPVDPSPAIRPLNIVYVGDVRDEKGYQFYPEIVTALWDEFIAPGHVKFTLQSNFADNPDVSRESAISQSILRGYSADMITHVPGPMDSERYRAFVDDADIVLITYKPDHYMARSSGIFIEAMKAGKPALIPAMTWMADELEPKRQARWREHFKDIEPSLTLPGGQWIEGADKKIEGENTRRVFATFQFVNILEYVAFIEVSLHDADNNDKKLACTLSQIGSDGAVCAHLSLDRSVKNLSVRYKIDGQPGTLEHATITTLSKAWNDAEDYACAIYPHQETKWIVPRLRDLIRHHEAYRKQVEDWRTARGDEFTPVTLVDRLLETAKGGVRA